ncbi:MAG: bifunctional glutamate N-acetyltransferase/amino-acid acetyltransferase ArgJ [Lachnospiraceae bacterium]|nr:bifunctional glutamate N-acetyltransferase/amino-acid acetyltransferase ArgJ [Lachnospiraceae bacterium]
MKITDGGITCAKGFKAAGVEAGIKYKNRPDMALIFSEVPCVAAATFTSNVVKAAPVKWDMDIVENSEYVQAVVVNSGIANACTKAEGMNACRETAEEAAKLLNIPVRSVLIGSTGVIGMQLPTDRIKAGVDKLVPLLSDSREAAAMAERAIMTTDTVPKEVAVTTVIDGKEVTVCGMSKGSGMIHPNMCTMLAYIATDASISREMLTKALKEDVKDTFNMISVDGDTSTNDTLIVMANGLAENKTIDSEGPDYDAFYEALHYVNETLAKKMAADGEGATALFETKVINADTKENARILAKSVICSSLTKAAVFGHDANWGRILCALGYSGVSFDPEKIDLYFENRDEKLLIYTEGGAADYSEEEATKYLSQDVVTVTVDMKEGSESATAWGCDLSYDYVKINADYRS